MIVLSDPFIDDDLGEGPASAIISGSIERGSHAVREAVVMISDLRQFTWMSENW